MQRRKVFRLCMIIDTLDCMKVCQKVLIKLLAGIITFWMIYFLVSSFLFVDTVTSIEPGWHTVIHPFGTGLKLTVIILVVSLFIYLIFKYVSKLLIFIGSKIFPSART